MGLNRRRTRAMRVGTVTIGGEASLVFQSMCATKTTDIVATAATARCLSQAGAGIVRVAVDTPADAAALVEIRAELPDSVNLSIDLQENYPLIEKAAPSIQKARYNPGHLHHRDAQTPWQEKVRWMVDVAMRYDLALRIGVNCGSVDPAIAAKFPQGDDLSALLASAVEHAEFLESIGFDRYCVSLKDSEPATVVELNRRFALAMPHVPLHLGVTEAGMPPEGILKTRLAFEPLLREGIGETMRVSLTVPNEDKSQEIEAARQMVAEIAAGHFLTDTQKMAFSGRLDIVSCPSCARVENGRFVELAQKIREITRPYAEYPIRIAVMGCRVNGPGETDDADLGLWCGADRVNLKCGRQTLGTFSYEEIESRFLAELQNLLSTRA